MKKIILRFIAIAVCSFVSTICQAQWVTQNSGTTQHLNDVFFINTRTGWICGDKLDYLEDINVITYINNNHF